MYSSYKFVPFTAGACDCMKCTGFPIRPAQALVVCSLSSNSVVIIGIFPADASQRSGSVLLQVERCRESLGVQEYSISQTTLEQVFVALAQHDIDSRRALQSENGE